MLGLCVYTSNQNPTVVTGMHLLLLSSLLVGIYSSCRYYCSSSILVLSAIIVRITAVFASCISYSRHSCMCTRTFLSDHAKPEPDRTAQPPSKESWTRPNHLNSLDAPGKLLAFAAQLSKAAWAGDLPRQLGLTAAWFGPWVALVIIRQTENHHA